MIVDCFDFENLVEQIGIRSGLRVNIGGNETKTGEKKETNSPRHDSDLPCTVQ
jgi:hypothetical protein